MIVENQRLAAEDILSSLENLGYAVSPIFGSGEEAIEKLKEEPPDLVLMDIMQRVTMNGIEEIIAAQ